MEKDYKFSISIIISFFLLGISIGILIGRYIIVPKPQILSGTGISGYAGVYNSTTPTLYNGQASAAAIDQTGNLIITN